LPFSTGREVSGSDFIIAEDLCLFATVVRVHTGGEIRGVINSVGHRESLFITRTAHFSVTMSCSSHESSHARCAVVKPTATMRAQN